jgi:hypothetical protein
MANGEKDTNIHSAGILQWKPMLRSSQPFTHSTEDSMSRKEANPWDEIPYADLRMYSVR